MVSLSVAGKEILAPQTAGGNLVTGRKGTAELQQLLEADDDLLDHSSEEMDAGDEEEVESNYRKKEKQNVPLNNNPTEKIEPETDEVITGNRTEEAFKQQSYGKDRTGNR
ncbi:hypothetical protein QE152_g8390 [Popillia japonica]|uniref:Uncharacterized protein n=1 Tax=Popillia japonica TaxID=7064 RepID=A0AAW1MCL8_POPJA